MSVMRAGSIGKVIKNNNNPNFEVGDCVSGWGGVQQYALFQTVPDGFKVDERLATDANCF